MISLFLRILSVSSLAYTEYDGLTLAIHLWTAFVYSRRKHGIVTDVYTV